MTSIAGWPVMAHKCATCPFGENGDVDVRNSVTERLVTLQGSQICHHPRLHGKEETRLCRGARDFQLNLLHCMGQIAEPTDACFAETSNKVLRGGLGSNHVAMDNA